jgi:hypothetical protein
VARQSTSEPNLDPEVAAITSIVAVLTPLDAEARMRVLDYSLRRLGVHSSASASITMPAGTSSVSVVEASSGVPGPRDIRTFAEEKKPKSANEMAAVIGYYLEYLAPEQDRKTEINAADIKKYFHQANFRLPARAVMTLVNAKNAGYFDAGSTRATYKLNPVGYNLVAHRLPSTDSSSSWSNLTKRTIPKRKSPVIKPQTRSRSTRPSPAKAKKAR